MKTKWKYQNMSHIWQIHKHKNLSELSKSGNAAAQTKIFETASVNPSFKTLHIRRCSRTWSYKISCRDLISLAGVLTILLWSFSLIALRKTVQIGLDVNGKWSGRFGPRGIPASSQLTSQLTPPPFGRDVKLGVPCLDAAYIVGLN